MVSEEFLTRLEKSILYVWLDEVKIPFNEAKIKYYHAKYSSSKKPSLTLFIDGKPLLGSRKYKYRVTYKCSCGRENTIHLTKFLVKERLHCQHCAETPDKVEWHKLFFKLKKEGKERGYREKKLTIYDFDSESDEFKNDYFKLHLHEDEFDMEIRPRLISVRGVNVENVDYEYILAHPCKNNRKYTPAIKIGDKIITLQDLVLKCDTCGKTYHISRRLREKVSLNNFTCRRCGFTNKTFQIKNYKHLTYQSQLELSFIKFCEDKGIDIEDGIIIPYYWSNQNRVYITDFYLPKLKLMIELKDMHVWHRRQLQTGKWQAKQSAAEKYCQENDMRYMIIYSDELNDKLKHIERDSLTSNEMLEKIG